MKHFGDITKLNGADLPTVDIITGGSPCQDLSVAGNRAGLAGERSGLFMEQIRIVKEMREHDKTNGRTNWTCRPRFMVWENVPGAFSSNKGKDFRAVLSEIIRVADENAPDVPMPHGNKWTYAGYIYDYLGRWSVAWRTHDAQYWGVPQRRRRICVLADWGGLEAGNILFERWRETEGAGDNETVAGAGGEPRSEVQPVTESLSGDPQPCGEAREGTAGSAASGIGATGYDAYQHHGWREREQLGPLTTGQNNTVRGDTPLVTYSIGGYNSEGMLSENPKAGIYEADTARTLDNNGGQPACNQGGIAVVALEGNGARPSHQGGLQRR